MLRGPSQIQKDNNLAEQMCADNFGINESQFKLVRIIKPYGFEWNSFDEFLMFKYKENVIPQKVIDALQVPLNVLVRQKGLNFIIKDDYIAVERYEGSFKKIK